MTQLMISYCFVWSFDNILTMSTGKPIFKMIYSVCVCVCVCARTYVYVNAFLG